MATITAPDLSTAAKASADKNTAELNDAFGHAAGGLQALYEDPSVPQHQKKNLFQSLGDRFFQGILPTVAALTGQPDARLALNGGTTTPDPVTAPASPAPTPADAENQALKAQLAAVKKYITDNEGTLIDGDLAASINGVVRKKEEAAKTAATAAATTANTDATVNKAAVKAQVDVITTAVANINISRMPGVTTHHVSAENVDKLATAANKLADLVN